MRRLYSGHKLEANPPKPVCDMIDLVLLEFEIHRSLLRPVIAVDAHAHDKFVCLTNQR